MEKEKIKYLLTRKGLTLADLDRKYKLRYGACAYALHSPSKRGEVVISNELNIPLQVLFPDRYDEAGKRHKPQPSVNYNYTRRGISIDA